MSNFLNKIKLIYLPFLLMAVCFIVLYSFLIWMVIYEFSLWTPNEDLIKFWLPFFLPAIPLYIWLRPRTKLLILKGDDVRGPFFYFFVPWMAVAAPTIVLQDYLLKATGKLTTIKNISEISHRPSTKYYKVANHYIDKQHATIHRTAEVSGRYNSDLTFYLYVACPILNEAPQISTGDSSNFNMPVAWLGIEFTKSIGNNSSSDAEKEEAFKQLGMEAYNKIKDQNLDQFIYLDLIGKNNRRKGYSAAIKSISQYENIEPIILEAKNEPFERRNGDKLGWIFISFGIGSAIWLIMLIFPKIETMPLKKLSKNSFQNQLKSSREVISSIAITQLPVWLIIAVLNIMVFVIMVFAGLGLISFEGYDLYAWGANHRLAVINGQWWRLLTNIFLHGGLMHLIFNLYGLFFVSIFLEPVLGRMKFIIAYIVCGLIASLASIWWYPAMVSVGASGAIFGLYGVLTALLTTNKVDTKLKNELLINNAIFIGINLVLGLAGGGIDNAAHIGGLLSGFMIGYIMYFFIDTPKPKRKYKKRKKVNSDIGSLVEKIE